MSYWTYVKGVIQVDPMGRTQEETEYILKTVLNHLPKVTGSEGDMHTHIQQGAGYNHSSGFNEFGEYVQEGVERQSIYYVIAEADLRDRFFEQTYKEFMKWIVRLAKRCYIDNALVKISGYNKNYEHIAKIIDSDSFGALKETPSWFDSDSVNWCEYLMWRSAANCKYPAILAYKYYADKDNDKRVENWLGLNKE